jgi:small subunit ribosomal protein S4
MHGFRGRRIEGLRRAPDEKQKLRYHYSVMERQFRRYVDEASRRKGNTGERADAAAGARLDNVIRRAGFTRTIWAARQMVVHGHVLVNGRKVDRPSLLRSTSVTQYHCETGIHKLARENMESLAGHIVPGVDGCESQRTLNRVLSVPTADQIRCSR